MEEKLIRALIMDVDGTLTNGSIFIGNSGEIMKSFHVRDGYAIKHMLPQMGIIPIIITGRTSDIVKYRCAELDISYIVQGSNKKIEDMLNILHNERIALSETAYIGDDLNDLECMEKVGLRGCPADAVEEIKEISDYIASKNGGEGAVREFIEWIKNRKT